ESTWMTPSWTGGRMFIRGRAQIVVAAGIVLRVVCGGGAPVEAQEDRRAPETSSVLREAELEGVYVRAYGVPHTICGGFDSEISILPPVYAGVTAIHQAPGLITIRNQFTPTRLLTFAPHREDSSGERAHWEGRTLVVE